MIHVVAGAMSIGITLGLLGSGGSIVTVPVLAYLVGQEQKVAIAGSLVIVGLISFIASLPLIKRKQVDWHSVLYFGVPGMIGTYLGAWAAGFVNGDVQFIAFAGVMVIAAYKMLQPKQQSESDGDTKRSITKIGLDGILVGSVTGFVGVGGGFLIVPALVILGGLTMQRAVATSLVIIAMKSLSGFIKYQQVLDANQLHLDWSVIALVTIIGIVGSQVGTQLNQRIPQQALKTGFGIFLVLMAGYISWQTVPALI
ncbi:permease [Vibrio sp. qd031]|uniref:sulfite exporter TauE/SafE family protein n=1 Tax=Vibrio sp. qd031 TaxID=1603038 RepID=UPI000A10E86F|nr:sulfite exporter TauE/SafE family protein [Vibrio sp. qd031]ORT48692.1 permease [Vibrio sp. qd031]